MAHETTPNRPGRGERQRSLVTSLSGTNLERAGDHNQRVTLQAIRVNAPITRADLAEITGLTAPAIANITKRLLDEGLIVEAGRIYGGRGQPAMRLAINPDGCFSIGVNIDRDHITFVVLDLMGKVRARATQEVDFALPNAVGAFFRKQVEEMLKGRGVPKSRLVGIGVALPDDLGRVNLPHRPASYEAWNSVDVQALFGDILPLPVYVENDAAAAAMGEMQFGHGLRNPTFFYVLISAALGGGLVVEGNYFRGANGRSGELGFLPIRARKTAARSLQEAVSLSALYEQLHAAGFKVSTPDELTALDTNKGAHGVISRWVDLSAALLAEPFIAVNCLVNPEAIFLGGRLPAEIVDRLAEKTSELLARRGGDIPSIAPVQRAAMAADAPAVGAAILPFNNQLLPSRAALMKTGTY
jgi:predicted NBD/HSP70 family sugar kinase